MRHFHVFKNAYVLYRLHGVRFAWWHALTFAFAVRRRGKSPSQLMREA